MDLKEPLWEKCKRVKIPWKTPAAGKKCSKDREQTILRGMAVVEFKE
ncbi:homeobox protein LUMINIDEPENDENS-like, partial [Trifolium medium]|nr:homeobox protein LUMINIDEPENDENS-like [Trifolium medium]